MEQQHLDKQRESAFLRMIIQTRSLPEITRLGALIGRYCRRYRLVRSQMLNQIYFIRFNKIVSQTDSDNL